MSDKNIVIKTNEIMETKLESSNESKMIIKGYANVAKVDRSNELMPADCWDVEDYQKNPALCLDHGSYYAENLIGKTLKIEARPEGLYFEAELGDESKGELTEKQKIARSLVKQGYLKGVSVGFKPVDYEYENNGLLVYKKVKLHEISLVTIPCQQDSFITSIKRLQDNQTVQQLTIKQNEKINELETKITELEIRTKSLIDNLLNIVKKITKLI